MVRCARDKLRHCQSVSMQSIDSNICIHNSVGRALISKVNNAKALKRQVFVRVLVTSTATTDRIQKNLKETQCHRNRHKGEENTNIRIHQCSTRRASLSRRIDAWARRGRRCRSRRNTSGRDHGKRTGTGRDRHRDRAVGDQSLGQNHLCVQGEQTEFGKVIVRHRRSGISHSRSISHKIKCLCGRSSRYRYRISLGQ